MTAPVIAPGLTFAEQRGWEILRRWYAARRRGGAVLASADPLDNDQFLGSVSLFAALFALDADEVSRRLAEDYGASTGVDE